MSHQNLLDRLYYLTDPVILKNKIQEKTHGEHWKVNKVIIQISGGSMFCTQKNSTKSYSQTHMAVYPPAPDPHPVTY